MYKNLICEMNKAGLEIKDFAEVLDISIKEVEKKINRTVELEDSYENDFLTNEAKIIRDLFFPWLSYEYLFEPVDEPVNENLINASLKSLSHELDWGVCGLESEVETLSDVKTKFVQVVANMNDAIHEGKEKLYFEEFFRDTKLLSSLMTYCIEDLTNNCKKVNGISKRIFSTVSKSQKNIKKA